jgi:uncharacterized protein (DUF362 family)
MEINRREFIAGVGAAYLGMVRPAHAFPSAPTAPVAIARCKSYGAEFLSTAEKMFDQLGGLGRLVKGKTVAIKINLTGSGAGRMEDIPAGRAFWTHPRTVGAVIHLLDKAGARRIRVVEGAMSWGASLEEFMLKTNWDPKLLLDAAPRVELINTNLPFPGKKPYSRFAVPNGGHLFASYDLNTAYDECDVLVSMNKIKEHAAAGITLSMKNCFGITPCTIYGNKAGVDEPGPIPFGGRQEIIHQGSRQPTKSAQSEKDPSSPRQGGYRIPRCVADLVAARPIHLCLLEGIETITGAELPRANVTRFVSPGILIAGTNCVTTDAVAAAVMGFDPMADRGTAPFERSDSTLRLAEELGVGTRDLSRIEVLGTPIREALFKFREVPRDGK